jgi:1-acyl-sn-glycerol-3-phosphate acyltransferase
MEGEMAKAKPATKDRQGEFRDPGPLARWMQPVVDALDHATAEQIHRDPFQRDPGLVREYLPYFKASALYFGTEIRGWENLPAEGPFLIVGNHSGGAGTNDSTALIARWVEERGPEAPLYSLAYDLLFAYPAVGRLLPKLGIVPASLENARRALAMGAPVLVFPGGDQEVFRPWTHRNKIEFGGHQGFLQLAIESGVPVVPMTTHGAHESTFVLTRGRSLARRMGLTRLRVKVFPLIWNIPFGVTPGFVPSLPLPAKVTLQLGEPLDWSHYGVDEARNPVVLQRCYDEITDVMQGTLDELAREHPYPVLTRLNELRPINVLRRFVARRRG